MITNKTNQLDFVLRWTDRMNGSHKPMIGNEYSVTELLRDATAIILKRRHYEEIETDVQDLADIAAGTAVHESIEKDALALGWITEFELSDHAAVDENEILLYGKGDLYRDGQLVDIKNTKEATYNKLRFAEDIDLFKNEWQAQLTAYAALLDINKPRWYKGVDEMIIEARLTDLSVVGNAKKGESTDKWRIIHFPAPSEEAKNTVLMTLYSNAEYVMSLAEIPDEELPICSDEFRYAEKVYKIYKRKAKNSEETNKTAVTGHAKYETMDDAVKGFDNAGFTLENYVIKEVGGESIKCKYYCDCKDFCPHYKKMMEATNAKTEN